MKVFSSQGKFNVFIIFLILAISSSLVGKLTSTYDKDILFKLVLTDLPKDKVVYDKSHDSVMLKVRGYGFNLAKYYFDTPNLNISVKKLKESNNTFLWNQKDNFNDTKLSFDSSIELLNISEDSLFFYYDQYISQNKKIKPNINFKGNKYKMKESKQIEKIRENKLDLTEENKKELYELSKGL